MRMRLVEQADGYSGKNHHRFLKKLKLRIERRRAKRNPECQPAYRKYRGLSTVAQ
jgi:hypothetical protein